MRKDKVVLICDRCGYSEDSDSSNHKEYGWGRIHAEQVNGPLGIGRGGAHPIFKDLCPSCLKEVDNWYRSPVGRVK
jgi:hypothetical protein